jgi:hypothetical protein
VTANQAPRRNRRGHPCPLWCTTDHGMPIAQSHGGATASIEVPGADRISARAVHLGMADDRPQVSVTTVRHASTDTDPHLRVAPGDAEHLAGLVEMLATATAARGDPVRPRSAPRSAPRTGAPGSRARPSGTRTRPAGYSRR